MESFFEILFGTIFSVAVIYSFFYVYYRLLDVGKTKVAKTLKFTILILYIAFVIWFPSMGYKIWFSIIGIFVCLVFADDDGFKNNKLTGAIVLTAVYGILWINAAPCMWNVLYPPHYKPKQQIQEKINVPTTILKQQKKEPSSDNKKDYSETKYNPPYYDYKPVDFDADDFTNDELIDDDTTSDVTNEDDINNDTDVDFEEAIRKAYRHNQISNSNQTTYNNYTGGNGSYSTNSTGDVYVAPYTRSDGTVVQGHYRSRPNSTTLDNYSHKGNINPYTGKRGYSNY